MGPGIGAGDSSGEALGIPGNRPSVLRSQSYVGMVMAPRLGML